MRSTSRIVSTPVNFKRRKSSYGFNSKFITSIPSYLFFFNVMKIEYIYIKFLRRKIKKIFFKHKKNFLNRKIWINLQPNYPLSKKATNARMGKGKGSFQRLILILKPKKIFIGFWGFNPSLIFTLTRILRFHFFLQPTLFTSVPLTYSWAQFNQAKYVSHSYKLHSTF